MSCSTDDHRISRASRGGTKRRRKSRQTRAVRLLIDYWDRAVGVKHERDVEDARWIHERVASVAKPEGARLGPSLRLAPCAPSERASREGGTCRIIFFPS